MLLVGCIAVILVVAVLCVAHEFDKFAYEVDKLRNEVKDLKEANKE